MYDHLRSQHPEQIDLQLFRTLDTQLMELRGLVAHQLDDSECESSGGSNAEDCDWTGGSGSGSE
jgi:hypothetical protein